MKKYISLIFLALGLAASAQGAYDFRLAPTTVSPAVKSAIEQNVSNLFTAINAAAMTGGDINFTGIDLTQDAKQSIVMTWENVHFTTAQDQYVGQLLKEKNSNGSLRGLQVRNQQVDMKPIDDTYEGWLRKLCSTLPPQGVSPTSISRWKTHSILHSCAMAHAWVMPPTACR